MDFGCPRKCATRSAVSLNEGIRWEELPSFLPVPCDLADHLAPLQDDGTDSILVLSERSLESIARHAGALSKEVLGLLLGKVLCDQKSGRLATIVEAITPVQETMGSRTSVQTGIESWAATWGTLPPLYQVVGWYHSHPGHGIFFSATDRQTQRRNFPKSWHVGFVFDPSNGKFGAFAGEECTAIRVLISGDVSV